MQTTSLLVRKRIAALFFLFTLGIFLLGGRIFWVQFVRGAELAEKAEQNRMRDEPVASKRGIIYDRNGKELAISVSADSISACPADVIASQEQTKIAHQLATILEMDEEKLLKTLTKRTTFVWVKRQIKPEQAKKNKGNGFTRNQAHRGKPSPVSQWYILQSCTGYIRN